MTEGLKEIRSTGYTPRVLQEELHRKARRFSVMVIHRRAGKTVFAVNHTIARATKCEHRFPRYAYFAPFKDQAKRIAWEMFKHYTRVFPGVKVLEGELTIEIPRKKEHTGLDVDDKIQFFVMGADNPNALPGIYLDGVVLDEYQLINPRVYTREVRPMLSDRKGWAIFTGKPLGKNHFYRVFQDAKRFVAAGDPEWFTAYHRADQTGIIDPKELAAIEKEIPEEDFQQEFMLSWEASVIGAYYKKQIAEARKSSRITSVKYEPVLPVYTFWDLGMNDTTAIWFAQFYGNEIRVIDFEEDTGVDIKQWGPRLKAKPYHYAEHVLPHDASVRSMNDGETRAQTLEHFFPNIVRILKREPIEEGIDQVRSIFPRCYFDGEKCERGLEALSMYRAKYDEKNGVLSKTPVHDWASNPADGFRTLAMGIRREIGKTRPMHDTAISDYDIYDPYGSNPRYEEALV